MTRDGGGFDGAHEGTLACEQGGLEVLRRPRAIVIRTSRSPGH
jgi:hypothetical protein